MSDESKIWEYLVDIGLSPEGTAALMGNLQAESGLNPRRVEGLLIKRYIEDGKFSGWKGKLSGQYNSDRYTTMVDEGEISKEEFLSPRKYTGKVHQYGYGLAQWTSYSRKEKLYSLAKDDGCSIGDLQVQLNYLGWELQNKYSKMHKTLKVTTDIKNATMVVLRDFECPKGWQSMVNGRTTLAIEIYQRQKGGENKMSTAKDVMDEAKKWIGTKESPAGSNNVIFNTKFYGHVVHGSDYPWCCAFVWYVHHAVGADAQFGEKTASCAQYEKNNSKYEIPKLQASYGDTVTFDFGNRGYAHHIGKVYSNNGDGTISTIEGNTSVTSQDNGGCVMMRRRKLSDVRKCFRHPYNSNGTSAKIPAADKSLHENPQWVGKVTAEKLNVRTWAGTENPNIKSYPRLNKGNLIDVCDTIKAKDNSKWYYIRIAGKYHGFVSAKYIQKV